MATQYYCTLFHLVTDSTDSFRRLSLLITLVSANQAHSIENEGCLTETHTTAQTVIHFKIYKYGFPLSIWMKYPGTKNCHESFKYRQIPVGAVIFSCHYCDVILVAMASQITSLTIVYSTVYSGADQRKHQCSASLGESIGYRWIPHTKGQ